MMNFIQGESWTQDLRLVRGGEPILVGPEAYADQHLLYIEVLLKVNTRVQARYRYPLQEALPQHELLEFDAALPNVVHIKITRNQSRFFEPGYLTAVTNLRYKDGGLGQEGKLVEVIQILGYLLKSDFAMRL